MDLTTLFAFCGVILSTVALTWNIMRDLNDRARLKLDAIIGKFYPDHTDRDYFVITMTNIGRRPIVVKSWGYLRKPTPTLGNYTGVFPIPQGLPRMLKEGEYHTEYTEISMMIESYVIEIHVFDSIDRKWCISKKQLRRLRVDLKKVKNRVKNSKNGISRR